MVCSIVSELSRMCGMHAGGIFFFLRVERILWGGMGKEGGGVERASVEAPHTFKFVLPGCALACAGGAVTGTVVS